MCGRRCGWRAKVRRAAIVDLGGRGGLPGIRTRLAPPESAAPWTEYTGTYPQHMMSPPPTGSLAFGSAAQSEHDALADWTGPGPAPVFSVIVPAYNEEGAIESTVKTLAAELRTELPYEIIVVNDGSKDGTAAVLAELASRHPRLRVIHHEANRGYGAALKTGLRHAASELIAITDADGTYPNHRLPELVERCRDQDMVVGARVGREVHYSKLRRIPKVFMRAWISWLAGRNVPDINSGMRVFRRSIALQFVGILPDGFSFTITITLAMLTTWRRVEFTPISYARRIGKSKIKPIRDTSRFLKIILRTGTYFAPLRAFMPFFVLVFVASIASLARDVFWLNDIGDTTVVLFLSSINVGMFMMLADMIDKRTSR